MRSSPGAGCRLARRVPQRSHAAMTRPRSPDCAATKFHRWSMSRCFLTERQCRARGGFLASVQLREATNHGRFGHGPTLHGFRSRALAGVVLCLPCEADSCFSWWH
jgi:hypothetical protein